MTQTNTEYSYARQTKPQEKSLDGLMKLTERETTLEAFRTMKNCKENGWKPIALPNYDGTFSVYAKPTEQKAEYLKARNEAGKRQGELERDGFKMISLNITKEELERKVKTAEGCGYQTAVLPATACDRYILLAKKPKNSVIFG